MFKKVGIFAGFLVAVFLVAGVVLAAEEAPMKMESKEAVATAPAETVATPAVEAPVNVGNKVCPVTGMTIDEMGKYTVEYQGKVYNLSSAECKDEFLKDPETYVATVNEELASDIKEGEIVEGTAVTAAEGTTEEEAAPAAPAQSK